MKNKYLVTDPEGRTTVNDGAMNADLKEMFAAIGYQMFLGGCLTCVLEDFMEAEPDAIPVLTPFVDSIHAILTAQYHERNPES